MRIFQGLDRVKEIKNPVLTIGTFDGVHLGHQKIISYLNETAKKIGGESTLFTFYPHPKMVLQPDNHGIKLIQTQEEKLEKLETTGLQNIIIQPFTHDFSQLTANEFVEEFLVEKLGVKHLVIGYDHHFGKGREGNIDFLKKVAPQFGFGITEISAEEIDEVNISSTKIRNAIQNGNIEIANSFLGNPFSLKGEVVKGKQLGRTFGFPTCNIDLKSDLKLLPPDGIYTVHILTQNQQKLEGILSIGTNPTISNQSNRTIEAYILDFEGDLYGTILAIELLHYIRPSEKFNSIDELIQQMKRDEEYTRNYFNNNV
ncbi:MAG: bifunctional riboflavin kinase/FAD synthetase [Crocinitomicaceae bacterium]|nr:bifunctional riboflavin kinase/FAD synthetase [Crocinitomicaceae bacterium]